MANKIRTFVNEADSQTYNSVTFYEYVEGETPYTFTYGDPSVADGMFIMPVGMPGYVYQCDPSSYKKLGVRYLPTESYPRYYGAYYHGFNSREDTEVDSYFSKFCPCSTDGAYSFTGFPVESLPAKPVAERKGATHTHTQYGQWHDTGVTIGGKKYWLRPTYKLTIADAILYMTATIDMCWAATAPAYDAAPSASQNLGWHYESIGYASVAGSVQSCNERAQIFYELWDNILKQSTFYFYITKASLSSSDRNPIWGTSNNDAYRDVWITGFIASYQDNWYGGQSQSNIATTKSTNATIVQNYSTEIDEYPDQPPRPAIPTTEEPNLAIVSLSAFKKALKTYDAQLPAAAKSGSYADLLNKPNTFTPPTMSASTIGGAKKGTGLDVSNGTLKVNLSTVDTGTLPIARGGTGGTSAAAARTALGAVALEDYLRMMFSDETTVEFALDNVHEDEGYKESYTIDDLSGPLCMYLAAYRNAVGAAAPLSNGRWFSLAGTGHNDTASGAGTTIDFDSGGAAGSVWTYPTFGLTIKLNTYTPNSGLGSQVIPAFTARITEGSSLYSAFANGVKVRIPVPTVYSILTALAFKQ